MKNNVKNNVDAKTEDTQKIASVGYVITETKQLIIEANTANLYSRNTRLGTTEWER